MVQNWMASIQGEWTSNRCRFSFDIFHDLSLSFSTGTRITHTQHVFSVSRINFSERQHWLHPIEYPELAFRFKKKHHLWAIYFSPLFDLFFFFFLTAVIFFSVVVGCVWNICGNTLFDSIVLISIKRLWRQTKEIPLKSADLMWNLCLWFSCQWTVYDIAFQHHHYPHSIQSTLNF